jgi:hypothetical protein
MIYAANQNAPYWHYEFGRSPKTRNVAGTIPKGGMVYLQRPPDNKGTHQSAYLLGVGRIMVRLGDFQPAPAQVSGN